jgi:hypothetical protein
MNDTFRFERLEQRLLPAVSITVGKNGLLKLTGDGAGDTVDIDGTGVAGEVDVFVNGGFVGTFSAVKTISADLKAGDDTVNISAIQIGGLLDLRMGSGADEVDIDNTTTLGGGPNGDVVIGNDVIVNMGGNAGDFIEWDSTGADLGITVGNHVTLTGAADVDLDGDGGTFGVEPEDINIGGNLKIALTGFGDVNGDGWEVDIDDVNVLGTTTLNGSGAVDRIEVTDSSFVRKVTVSLGGGDDLLDVDGGAGQENQFSAAVVVNGGAGSDTVDNSVLNLFAVPPVLKQVENVV